MKKDIIIAGVGGQGILTIATVIGTAALMEGLQLKQAEVHGMSQRGGDVQSNLRISSKPIASDLIPEGKADLIISVEPMESLRYVNMLNKKEGWLVTSMNIVVLGAASPYLGLSFKALEKAITSIFSKKSQDLVDLNLKALAAGKNYAIKRT